MKKTSRMIIALMLCIAVFIQADRSIAYQKYTDTVINHFSGEFEGPGNIAISIALPSSAPVIQSCTSGSSSYSAAVKNDGDKSVYIRLSVLLSDSSLENRITLPGLGSSNGWVSTYANGSGFLYGYYYYTLPIAVGETTPSALNSISYTAEISEDELYDFSIIFYAEAIESRGYSSYLEAWRAADTT